MIAVGGTLATVATIIPISGLATWRIGGFFNTVGAVPVISVSSALAGSVISITGLTTRRVGRFLNAIGTVPMIPMSGAFT